jgi:hypothetical protein
MYTPAFNQVANRAAQAAHAAGTPDQQALAAWMKRMAG